MIRETGEGLSLAVDWMNLSFTALEQVADDPTTYVAGSVALAEAGQGPAPDSLSRRQSTLRGSWFHGLPFARRQERVGGGLRRASPGLETSPRGPASGTGTSLLSQRLSIPNANVVARGSLLWSDLLDSCRREEQQQSRHLPNFPSRRIQTPYSAHSSGLILRWILPPCQFARSTV